MRGLRQLGRLGMCRLRQFGRLRPAIERNTDEHGCGAAAPLTDGHG